MLTPENNFEEAIVKQIATGDQQVSIYRASFYETRGGYFRMNNSGFTHDSDSLMIRLKINKPPEVSKMKEKWNERLFWWIRLKILKAPETGLLSKKWYFLAYLLMPINAIRHTPTADPRFEPWDDLLVIYGRHYSARSFYELAKGENDHPGLFRIIKEYDRYYIDPFYPSYSGIGVACPPPDPPKDYDPVMERFTRDAILTNPSNRKVHQGIGSLSAAPLNGAASGTGLSEEENK